MLHVMSGPGLLTAIDLTKEPQGWRMSDGSISLVAGHEVHFPHKAYSVQLSFMAKVLEALDTGKNALLEAPTGSGKTLALLCSASQWLLERREGLYKTMQARVLPTDSQIERAPEAGVIALTQKSSFRSGRVFYATRTHAQIKQVVHELRKTAYEPRTAILAARHHYCVNKDVVDTGDIGYNCQEAVKLGTCSYFRGTDRLEQVRDQILDIEDLVKAGRRLHACPYFGSKQLAEKADLVFCPYNYLLDPDILETTGLSLEGDVIIFDEAHNIEDQCRHAATFQATIQDLDMVRDWFERNQKTLSQQGAKSQHKELFDACQILEQQFKSFIEGFYRLIEDNESSRSNEIGWSADFSIRKLALWGLDSQGANVMHASLGVVKKAREDHKRLLDDQTEEKNETQPSQHMAVDGGIPLQIASKLATVLRLLYEQSSLSSGCFRLVSKRSGGGSFKQHEVSLVCLDPSVLFGKLAARTHAIILTSGTLSPMGSFASELGVNFQHRLEGNHVVNMAKQVWVGASGVGADGKSLRCVFSETGKTEFLDRIGLSLLEWCRGVPDGVLVFLPSYNLLDKLMERWKASGMLKRLKSVKPVFQEPRGRGPKFDETIQRYYRSIENRKGGLFLGVCRGKASEGMNFADQYARSVVMIGIPFPNMKDSSVLLKREYNDGRRGSNALSGSQWYEQQAYRALNQGIGRCIRHQNDFGAILLLDERFHQGNAVQSVSRWVRDSVLPYNDFGSMRASVEEFFVRAKQDIVPPKPLQGVSVRDQKQKVDVSRRGIRKYFSNIEEKPSNVTPKTEVIDFMGADDEDEEDDGDFPHRALPLSFSGPKSFNAVRLQSNQSGNVSLLHTESLQNKYGEKRKRSDVEVMHRSDACGMDERESAHQPACVNRLDDCHGEPSVIENFREGSCHGGTATDPLDSQYTGIGPSASGVDTLDDIVSQWVMSDLERFRHFLRERHGHIPRLTDAKNLQQVWWR